MTASRLKAYLSLLIVSLIWGIAGPVIKVTLQQIPPFAFLFWRFLLSSLILYLPLAKYLQNHPLTLKQILSLVVLGLLSTTINLSLIFLGFERTTALDGSLLSAVTPIFIVAAGVVFLREKVTSREKIGLGIAILGTLITLIQPLLEYEKGRASQNFSGNLLIIFAGFEWILYIILAKKLTRDFSPFLMMSTASFAGLGSFIPLAYFEKGGANLNFNTFLGISYMAIFSYIIAYFLFQWSLAKIEASETAPFAYLQPLFAAPFAIFWLGEKITLSLLIGASIIFTGVIISQTRKQE